MDKKARPSGNRLWNHRRRKPGSQLLPVLSNPHNRVGSPAEHASALALQVQKLTPEESPCLPESHGLWAETNSDPGLQIPSTATSFTTQITQTTLHLGIFSEKSPNENLLFHSNSYILKTLCSNVVLVPYNSPVQKSNCRNDQTLRNGGNKSLNEDQSYRQHCQGTLVQWL